MTDQRADVAGWITPPADGGERLDGRSAALITADRVLTGRRGRAEGGLEVLGGADDAAAREAGRGGQEDEGARQAGAQGAVRPEGVQGWGRGHTFKYGSGGVRRGVIPPPVRASPRPARLAAVSSPYVPRPAGCLACRPGAARGAA